MVASASSYGQTPKTAETGIEGTVAISPSHPGPTRDNESGSAPLANVAFAVEDGSGAVINFTTDDQGRFRVLLKPGHYKVSIKGENRIRRCGPWDVDVGASQMTKVEWQCDSGMR
jgi:hypothetical protein